MLSRLHARSKPKVECSGKLKRILGRHFQTQTRKHFSANFLSVKKSGL